MSEKVAKIAVSAATYWIDRPYDYRIPDELAKAAVAGARVYVPYGRGNRLTEGMILAVTGESKYDKLKSVASVLDASPVLDAAQLQLALFMRERFFCTVYDAVKAMLPAGLWIGEDGRQRAAEKSVETAKLLVSCKDALTAAEAMRRRSPMQAALLDMLSSFESLPTRDLLRHTGAQKTSLKALSDKGLVELKRREIYRTPELYAGEERELPVLNAEQSAVLEGISELAGRNSAGAALLFGVTGSGKTSIYIHLIKAQLDAGRASILLVPEIALTPQMLRTFSSHFGGEVAVLHSSLTVGERYDEWRRIKEGKAHVVIGTRSAVFAPCPELGMIIIDEEQEESYRSENNPRYNARDVAKFRCARAGRLLLLGSATPELSSMYSARIGRYSYFELKKRYNEMELPGVKIVDMKGELRSGNGGSISSFLRRELQANIDAGEQSILFINRRGANKLVSCGECGYTYKCPRCSVSLTYHSYNDRLMCHYCGYSKPLDSACPDCAGKLCFIGAGTQLVEQELHELFPGVGVIRLDTDTVAPAGSHEKLFSEFRNKRIPIMVGTQMVTKGLNFDNVTLVGVISADQSLYAGDYRAGERTFSLITQVIGRSGRGSKPGRAVIQTFTPTNETIVQAARQDYADFYSSEIELRKLQNTPPFADILAVTVSGAEEDRVMRASRFVRDELARALSARADVRLLGPAPMQIVKVNNRYRYRVNISCIADRELRSAVANVVIAACSDKRFKDLAVYADNDPAEQ